MVQHLYPDFLTTDDEYRRAEEYWRALMRDIAATMGQGEEWVPWMTRTFGDETPFPRDGNPIFDARSERLGRALRIIQAPPESNDLEIAAWLDTFDFSESGGPGYTEELLVNLALSEEAASIVRALVERWMDPSISMDQMNREIQDLMRSR